MKKLLSLLLITSFVARADEVAPIKKGEPAPFSGYIFDYEAEQKNQFHLIRKDRLEEQVKLYKENEIELMANLNRWQNVAQQNTEALLKVERYSFWQNAVFFGLGVVVTGALAIGLSKNLN